MALDYSKNGLCPVPFLQEDLYPAEGGFVHGRSCAIQGNISCCLPCPQVDWRYKDDFMDKTAVANWLALAVFVVNGFMLITYAVLPVKYTHRHYLSICLIVAIMLMELSFIIPLGAQPQQCYNAITPNDMKSDITCAFTSALILGGGWSVILWSFCRTLSLHLQICWDVVPGQKFFIATMAFGWGIPIAGVTVALAVTGSSYRFGSICHINHDKGLYDFWGPLMAFAAATLIIHLGTLGYCIQVYVKSMLDNNPTTDNSSTLPSYTGSVRTLSARQTYRRVRRVLQLQWRGVAVVITILANVIFFTIIFLSLDNSARRTPENSIKHIPWLECLVIAGGDRNRCVAEASTLGPSEAAMLAVLILLSLSGFWTIVFLGHVSMITGWFNWIKEKLRPNKEFVSMDARVTGTQSRAYEMLSADRQQSLKSPEPLLSRARDSDNSIYTMGEPTYTLDATADNLAREAKYNSPPLSFSTPRPPSASRGFSPRDWDPRSTFAPSQGGGAHWYENKNSP
ncbi:hypothetical protein D8B26_003994 [Coccidioides posadasii str. Silveira]|uniref:Uncharacterized protein n=3 Tax=Coccidioides posadasii TaxID=199306 RepID=E9DJY5_COCPS|nr:conserved hypothetical protein [Coccidioides posadasii str. Silveira]KMM70172.1 hypothetical protein CPAG_06484 [Coccidioides posadasii RMSCC 3488]QVM09331.1 hypothetical protein D8B26_003994 [Coccidioides posadasii str. Silveira]